VSIAAVRGCYCCTRCEHTLKSRYCVDTLQRFEVTPKKTSHAISCLSLSQNNHTYQNSSITAAKKPNQTLHPTPVLSAICNIRVMVPFNLHIKSASQITQQDKIQQIHLPQRRPTKSIIHRIRQLGTITNLIPNAQAQILQPSNLPDYAANLLIALRFQMF
jgi:hypothetical protein